jgi:hypothetical protein
MAREKCYVPDGAKTYFLCGFCASAVPWCSSWVFWFGPQRHSGGKTWGHCTYWTLDSQGPLNYLTTEPEIPFPAIVVQKCVQLPFALLFAMSDVVAREKCYVPDGAIIAKGKFAFATAF